MRIKRWNLQRHQRLRATRTLKKQSKCVKISSNGRPDLAMTVARIPVFVLYNSHCVTHSNRSVIRLIIRNNQKIVGDKEHAQEKHKKEAKKHIELFSMMILQYKN